MDDQEFRQEYEIIFEDGLGKMTVSRGKVHKYLGMTLDYTVRGQGQITMIDFPDEFLISLDKAEPKIARIYHRVRLCSFKIWWQRLYMPPNEPSRTLAEL